MKVGTIPSRLIHGLRHRQSQLLPVQKRSADNAMQKNVAQLFAIDRIQVTIFLCLLIALSAVVSDVAAIHAQTDQEPVAQEQDVEGYDYTVQPGDNWSSVAARTNTTVAELRAANPRAAARSSGWLITGERLFIPVTTRMKTVTYVVEYGDSWSTIAKSYGISMQLLKAANPKSLRYDDVLYRGETLFIPLVDEAAASADTATQPTAASTSTASGSSDATVTEAADSAEATPVDATPTPNEGAAAATAEPTAEATTAEAAPAAVATAEEPSEDEAAVTETPTAEPVAATCPDSAAAYPDQLLARLSNGDDADALLAYLTECTALDTSTISAQDLTGDSVDEYVVVYPVGAPAAGAAEAVPPMDLVIFNSGSDGYTIGYQAHAESAVQLLSTADVNSDGQADVVWTETTCGATDCFQTLLIESWDGTAWRNWSAEKATMANAELTLEDVTDEGQGLEFVLDGGVYESPDAGPQRARHEVWASIEGAPYTLFSATMAASDCLYHTVLDANQAFLKGADDDFAAAETLYTAVISDDTLVACGTHPAEIEELRSFGIFRLALISAYQGMPLIVSDLIDNLSLAFPDSLYEQVGHVWLETYQENYDVNAACAAVDGFVAEHPATVAILADYGFANPTFTAQDVCPRLDVEIPPLTLPTPEPTPTLEPTATLEPTSTPVEEPTPTVAENEETSDGADSNKSDAASESEIDPAGDGDAAARTDSAGTADATTEEAVALDDDGLPLCPENLAGYSAALPLLLTAAAGDPLIVETWLRTCGAMDDTRGTFRLVDLNGDRFSDAIFFPTIVSDLGFGRDGAQGAILIYHGSADGSYTLVANPEVYGEPRLLAIDDLNNDRVPDIAWSIEGCSSFCVLEVQIVTWAADTYTTTIAPGATITEGEAHFEAVPSGSPGNGQQLVLTGGVSGTPDGGLAVPHTEIWQSVNRTPFQRISWTYDRTVEGSDCLGLRLVEADAALQAAPAIGYTQAIDLYRASMDPTLKACSIYEMDGEEELALLQGLARFRLLQAQALSGDLSGAGTTLAALQQAQPDGDFAAAADKWLTRYVSDGDDVAACAELLDIFEENEDLWQITDNYGYNHPALGPEQICFNPAD